MSGPREELRQRMAARLMTELKMLPTSADEVTFALIGMFNLVEDRWDRVDTSTYTSDSWIDNRFLVASVPAQGIYGERKTDRRVMLPYSTDSAFPDHEPVERGPAHDPPPGLS